MHLDQDPAADAVRAHSQDLHTASAPAIVCLGLNNDMGVSTQDMKWALTAGCVHTTSSGP